MQNIFIDVLPPWVETGLQPAFYDLESGTVLQQTARMYAKVNEIATGYSTFTTNVTNEINRFEQDTNDEIERFEQATNDEVERFEGVVNDTVEEYIEKFNDLHDYVEDYFDNLDVQEEINNKLDDMAEAGTLADIIAEYLNSIAVFGYDNVASMKTSENLIAGSYAKTLGYYSKSDGGGATYKIRLITNDDVVDEATIIALSDETLVAELVIDGKVVLNQFGCKGDSLTDDTDNIKKAIAYAKANNLDLEGVAGNTYLIDENIDVSNLNIDMHYATIKITDHEASIDVNSDTYGGSIKNTIIDANNLADIALNIIKGKQLHVYDLKITNIKTKGVYVGADSYEVFINGSNLTATNDNTIGIDIMTSDCHFTDIVMIDCKTAFHTNGINFFTRCHPWMWNPDYYLGSKMFDLEGSASIFTESCYSDTYQYTFYTTSYPKTKNNNLMVSTSSHVVTSELLDGAKIYLIHTANEYADYRSTFSNCFFRCLGSGINLNINNHEENEIAAHFSNCEFLNCTKNFGYNNTWITDLNKPTGLTVLQSKIETKNNVQEINFEASYVWNPNGRQLTLPSLPSFTRPLTDITTIATYGTGRWDINGSAYCYIGAGGGVQIKLPSSVSDLGTDTLYLHLHITYPVAGDI